MRSTNLQHCYKMAQVCLSSNLVKEIIKTVIWSAQNVFKH